MTRQCGLVKSRLYAWGDWRKADVLLNGYPGMSSESRDRLSPGRCTKPGYGPDYKMATDEILETDSLIMGLKPDYGFAIWFRYVQGTPPKRCAVFFKLPNEEAYWNLLSRAERSLGSLIRSAA